MVGANVVLPRWRELSALPEIPQLDVRGHFEAREREREGEERGGRKEGKGRRDEGEYPPYISGYDVAFGDHLHQIRSSSLRLHKAATINHAGYKSRSHTKPGLENLQSAGPRPSHNEQRTQTHIITLCTRYRADFPLKYADLWATCT